MDKAPVSEDIFRSWKLTPDEIMEEVENSLWYSSVDSSPAWQHFEKFFASRGYELLYYIPPRGDPKKEARRPAVDLTCGLGDPFQPDINKPLPFVYHDPSNFSYVFEKATEPWLIRRPRLIYAYDKFNRIVVIKALRVPGGNSEVETLKSLNSEALRPCRDNHTIPLLEHIVSDEGWQFLVMPAWRMTWEYSFRAWQVDDYFNVITQALEGLAFMHKNGFVHGDISVENLVFNQDGTAIIHGISLDPIISQWDFRVAIIDFDLSMKFDPTTDPSTWISMRGLGTYPFNSPEKKSAEETGIPFQLLPADIYALGASFTEILVREKDSLEDFRRISKYSVFAHDVLKRHVPQFEAMLTSMTDDDPAKRPTTEEALERFRGICESLPSHIRYAPPEGYPASLMSGCEV